MSLRNRLKKARHLLPRITPKKELNPKVNWLIDSSQEFRESFKSLYRLQIKAGMPISRLDEWDNDLAEAAKVLVKKLNDMYNNKIEEN